MRNRFAGPAMCLAVLMAAGCAIDEPVAQPPAVAPRTADPGRGLPAGTDLDAVAVTRPSSPTSVDPELLPAAARVASAMPGLTDDERICIDATVHGTIEQDAAIADDQGRLASVVGTAISLCAGDRFTATLVDGLLTDVGVGADDAACVRDRLTVDDDLRARVVGATATASLTQLDDAITDLEDTCGFTLEG